MSTFVYDVVIDGIVAGQPFERTGKVVIGDPIIDPFGTSNDVNSFEVGLFSTDSLLNPTFAQGVGSITFLSNNALAQRDPLDTVYEGYDPATNTYYVEPDSAVAFSSLNTFTNSGLTGLPYNVLQGVVALQPFEDGTISGSINFSGTANTSYQATLVGSLTQVI